MFGRLAFENTNTPINWEDPQRTHPWYRQLLEDLDDLGTTDQGSEVISDLQGNPTRLFEDPELAERFLMLDPAELKRRFHNVCIPPPGLAPAPHEDVGSSSAMFLWSHALETSASASSASPSMVFARW